MKNGRLVLSGLVSRICLLLIGILAVSAASADQFRLDVVDNEGNPVSGFRWLLQEDLTYPVDPGNPASTPDELLALNFHTSYHPPATAMTTGEGLSGNEDTDSLTILDVRPGRYYVSILPYSGYGISGTPVSVLSDTDDPSQNLDNVTVVVQRHPTPTAQISIYLFHDIFPINGAPDLPQETNPAVGEPDHVDWTGFSLFLEEPAGRYGVAGGQVISDIYGNPLGTTYLRGCDENGDADADPGTDYGCLDGNGDPTIVQLGDGTLHPNPDGTLIVRNLSPAKYGVVMIPPTGSNWLQTATLEGKHVIDAWVKAKEPAVFVEFGPPGPHVFIGFLKSTADGGFPPIANPPGNATLATVAGTVTDMHLSRPTSTQFFSGRPFPGCWVGLNDNNAGLGAGIFAGPCDGDSNFSIPAVPPGNYQLKVFDANLDVIIATMGLTVDSNGDCVAGTTIATGCNLDEVPVFNWFARLNTGIFNDENQNGFWDTGETGIGPESQDVGLRWRDGTIYQNWPTDNEGFAPFDEVFPFFHWLVAEVSFGNKKATGATYVVDAGGLVDTTADSFPSYGELNPQMQADGQLHRTETGQVLTAGVQAMLGQTSVMHFGKTDYMTFDFANGLPATYVGENGGISGIIYYSTTRAENEPQFAAAEEWEPGIPRVQLDLYADGDIDSSPLGDWPAGDGDVDWDADGVFDLDDNGIDDVDLDGLVTLADVDNYPLGWSDPACADDPAIPGNECVAGAEDIDRNIDGIFDLGDAIQVTWTDSWDDSLPTGCQGANNIDGIALGLNAPVEDTRCFDGLRNFNQIRDAVFDGGYAFTDYDMDRLGAVNPDAQAAILDFFAGINAAVGDAVFANLQLGLLPGTYIVQSATPPGYEHIKEEDRNVDFGDGYIPGPGPQAFPVDCVGDDHLVPPYFSMTTRDGSGEDGQLIAGIDPADAAAPFAGDTRSMCDRKKVPLSAGQNAAAEFFMMTDVPVVANVSGVTLNDLGNEFNPNSPNFSEKAAPPSLPIAFYDWQGKAVNRIYGDKFGRYNAVLPSTFSVNLPEPSGMSPNMLISCMNDAGPIPNPDYNPAADDESLALITDPFFDRQYSQFCYTFQYMPGAITYLDTPVVPISAYTTPGPYPLDCERPTQTPMIASVAGAGGTDGPFALPGDEIRVKSMGLTQVPNPEWNGTNLGQKSITRDYQFDLTSIVELEAADGTRTVLAHTQAQTASRIFAEVPAGFPAGDYQVVVTNGAGVESPIGATLTVGTGVDTGLRPDGGSFAVHRVSPAPYPSTPIQDAIDLAEAGDLILVSPGAYDEMVIMWKPVKLQGWGAGEVFLNARQAPTEKILSWRQKALELVSDGSIDQLPGQELEVLGAFPALNETLFATEEGAAILVAGKLDGNNSFADPANQGARIDGFSIMGASSGGGIIVNGYNQYLQIGNNRVTSNGGAFGGGIRIGHPQLSLENVDGDIVYDDAQNDNIRIHHNHVAQNGGFGGAGGGISLNQGSDDYRVQNNWVCGNFTQGDGAGIAHLGLSNNGLIEDNYIILNEQFSQGTVHSGGGLFIGGQAALAPNSDGLLLSPGTGNVIVDSNVIRGNLAGVGDGSGVRIESVNGDDVWQNPDNTELWYRVLMFNNMITNNIAGLAGAVSIQDALLTEIYNSTVANNESTATSAEAFAPGSPNLTTAMPGGIVSRLHSGDLETLMATLAGSVPDNWLTFSDPVLENLIVRDNRSFYWENFDNPATEIIETGLFPATCDDSCDLAVLNGLTVEADMLDPHFSLLTDTTGYAADNFTGATAFANGYVNSGRDNLNIPEFTTLQTAAAFDEGGNFIQVSFGPLSILEPGLPGTPDENTTLLDYHITDASAAIDMGTSAGTHSRRLLDIDNDARPQGDGVDVGADETVFVAPANTAPSATDDGYATADSAVLAGNVITDDTGNGIDSDADGDAITATQVSADPANALSFTFSADGSFSYQSTAGFIGDDTFTYLLNDGTDDGNTATVSITVTAATAQELTVTTADCTRLGSGNCDWLFEGDKQTGTTERILVKIGSCSGTPVARTSTNVGDGSWQIVASNNSRNNGLSTMAVCVPSAGSTAQVLGVVPTEGGGGGGPNEAPVANADAAATDVATAVVVDVLANDTDANGDALEIASFDATSVNGSAVSCNTATGDCTYTPTVDGVDTFAYTATDGTDTSASATVTVTVTLESQETLTVTTAQCTRLGNGRCDWLFEGDKQTGTTERVMVRIGSCSGTPVARTQANVGDGSWQIVANNSNRNTDLGALAVCVPAAGTTAQVVGIVPTEL